MWVHHAEHPVSCFSRKDAGLLCRASNMPDVLINFELIWWSSSTAGIVIMMTLKDILRPWSHLGYLKLYLSFSSIRFTVWLGYFYRPVSFQCEVFVLHASGMRCDQWHGKLEVQSQNTQAVGASAQSDSEGLWQVSSARDQLAVSERVSVALSCWVGSNPVLAGKMVSAEIYLARCFEQQRGCTSVLSVMEPGVPTVEASDPAVMVISSWGVFPSVPWECAGQQPLAWGQQGWHPCSPELCSKWRETHRASESDLQSCLGTGGEGSCEQGLKPSSTRWSPPSENW